MVTLCLRYATRSLGIEALLFTIYTLLFSWSPSNYMFKQSTYLESVILYADYNL